MRRDRRRFVDEVDKRSVADAFDIFKAPVSDPRFVQIIRPFSVFSKNSYSSPVTPPIGPAYLAAVLEKARYCVEILDCIGEEIFQIKESACGHYKVQGLSVEQTVSRLHPNAGVIGISLMFSQDWILHRELIREIRKARPDTVIVAGGEHVTALPEFVLRDCPEIDFVITGEAELTFLHFVHSVYHGLSTDDIPGCSYIDAADRFVGNDLSRRIEVIDELPQPAWHLCKVENYFIDHWTMGVSKGRNMPILATRGCPYQCTFCSNPTMWTTRYKMRDVASVVDEIEHLIREYGANSIDFFDLTAIVKKQWTLDFCEEIKKRGLKFSWQLPSGTRSEALDEEVLNAMIGAGCEYLVYAPESGSAETLKAIKKKVDLKNISESIRTAVEVGHTVKVNLIVGFPHERIKHVLQTLGYAFRMALSGASDCNISKFSPYPGSEIFRELRSEGVIPGLNDDYFRTLVSQFDLTAEARYCRGVPSSILALSTIVGHSVFYIAAYLRRPARIWRIIWLMLKSDFRPGNLLEQRVHDVLIRSKIAKNNP